MDLHGAAAAPAFCFQPADVSCLYNHSDAGSESSGDETVIVEIVRPGASSTSAQGERESDTGVNKPIKRKLTQGERAQPSPAHGAGDAVTGDAVGVPAAPRTDALTRWFAARTLRQRPLRHRPLRPPPVCEDDEPPPPTARPRTRKVRRRAGVPQPPPPDVCSDEQPHRAVVVATPPAPRLVCVEENPGPSRHDEAGAHLVKRILDWRPAGSSVESWWMMQAGKLSEIDFLVEWEGHAEPTWNPALNHTVRGVLEPVAAEFLCFKKAQAARAGRSRPAARGRSRSRRRACSSVASSSSRRARRARGQVAEIGRAHV